MRKSLRALEILIGLVFAFSGFVKAVDPLGTKYKLIDYFSVLHLDFMSSLALPLAILLISVELLVGVMFLFNLLPKIALWLSSFLLAVFTPLTLFLAIKNPILDCGCFGDALHLTNWQTFGKNIVFDLIIIILWVSYKNLKSSLARERQWIWSSVALIVIILFQVYNLMFLPVIDFRPYKVGTNIRQKLSSSQDQTQYRSALIYKNIQTGEVREFDEDNVPWEDTNWVWQETKTIVVKKGNETGIHDFFFYNTEHQDITDSLLSIKEPVLFIISPDLSKANPEGVQKIIILARQFTSLYYPVAYLVTGSTDNNINEMKNRLRCNCIEILSADETMLKTIIRSNPGIIILRDGQILGKYSWRKNIEKILNDIHLKLQEINNQIIE